MEQFVSMRIERRRDEYALIVYVTGGGACTPPIPIDARVTDVISAFRTLADTLERSVAHRAEKRKARG